MSRRPIETVGQLKAAIADLPDATLIYNRILNDPEEVDGVTLLGLSLEYHPGTDRLQYAVIDLEVDMVDDEEE